MIELAQHIEALLLENECVIIPGLGGFVAHYTPTTGAEEGYIFLPPIRIIGFNPQLKINDGLIVQSYMSVYGISFSDATKMVERKVEILIAALHEDGKVDLPNVGEIQYTIHNTFEFVPYDNKITTPYLYGLYVFEMSKLSVLENLQIENTDSYFSPVSVTIKKKKTILTSAAAIVAAIVFSFFFSVPIENTGITTKNYAQLSPYELYKKTEKQSLAIIPIIVEKNSSLQRFEDKNNTQIIETDETNQSEMTINAPTIDIQPIISEPIVTTPYHIIIASIGTEQEAKEIAVQMIAKGFSNAKVIIGDGKIRVGIESCETKSEAYRALAKIRQNETFKNAWVLKK